MRYDARTREVVLPGVSLEGVPLGGKTFVEARALVEKKADEELDRPLTVIAGGTEFVTSPRELGAKSDALARLDEATDRQGAVPMFKRVWFRLTGDVIETKLQISMTVKQEDLVKFVDKLAASVDRAPQDAQIALAEDQSLSIQPEVQGFKLEKEQAALKIADALKGGDPKVEVPGASEPAAVGKGDFTDVIVVNVSEHKLYHYEHGALRKVYGVATGAPGYPTPKGQFQIINKRKNPTWVNPAPNGWGRGMPRKIGPGRSNPLGTRALDLNSPGIRIHGTYNSGSIGSFASHGCIRMVIADVEELFELVEVGTPVLIVGTTGSSKAPRRGSGEPSAENDGSNVPGQPAPGPEPTPSDNSPSPSGQIVPLPQ